MLTDAQVRSLKPGKKHYKRYDQRGLFLEVRTTGAETFCCQQFGALAGVAQQVHVGTGFEPLAVLGDGD